MKVHFSATFAPIDGVVTNAQGDTAQLTNLVTDYFDLNEEQQDENDYFLGGINQDDTGDPWPEADKQTLDFYSYLNDAGAVVVDITVRYALAE